MSAATTEQEVLTRYGIAPNQIYVDNDKREAGRRLKVVSVYGKKPGKAACVPCDQNGNMITSRSTWISFERLANKKFFTRAT